MKQMERICFAVVVWGLATIPILGAPQKTEKLPDGSGGDFDVSRHSIPLEEIRAPGPAKDGIPSLTDPSFVTVKEADKFLRSWDRVLGVQYKGVAKAYPIKILNWHDIVNDRIADKAITVSW